MTYTGSEVALLMMLTAMVSIYATERVMMWMYRHHAPTVAETPDEDPRGEA